MRGPQYIQNSCCQWGLTQDRICPRISAPWKLLPPSSSSSCLAGIWLYVSGGVRVCAHARTRNPFWRVYHNFRLGGDMGRLKFAFNNLLRLYVSKMKIHALKTWQTLFNRSGKFRLYLLCVSSSQEDSEQYTSGECLRIQGRVRRGSFQNFSVYQKGQGF